MNSNTTQYSAAPGADPSPETQIPTRPSWVARAAMRAARARWFLFLRRVFHYQNGTSRSSLGSNPFNTSRWMAMELAGWTVQICVTLITLSVSGQEKPVWPMRIWVVGYDCGCFMSLLILYWRYSFYRLRPAGDDVELQHPTNEDERGGIQVVNRCKATVEMLYAMWFVMGNVWVFDTRVEQSFRRAPKLHALSIFLLATNAAAYSFPFLLFLLLCVVVPLLSSALGFSLTLSSSLRAASDHQISLLPSWRFKHDLQTTATLVYHSPECCICLGKYKEKEEIRQLPCSHIFHQKCVDHWLRIISCCPLCKQPLHP
ncbi:hypothetical protein V2J09_018310 [Rumex salicifolius]